MNNHNIRFDAIRGTARPYRLTQRATLADLERIASDLGLTIAWQTMRMIGLTTAEVTLTRPVSTTA